MPTMHYPGAITVVDNAALAHQAIGALSTERIVGFDTETDPRSKRACAQCRPYANLDQEPLFLFGLNKIGICAELKAFLENPDILKIGLSVHDDFNVLRRTTPLEPQGFIDLQQMVRNYEITDISLQKIYAIVFGERISKSQRLTNWEADTLTTSQQSYAALDAWACPRLYEYFESGSFDPISSPYRHIPEPAPVKTNK